MATKQQDIDKAKRLVAAEQKAEQDTEKYVGLVQKTQIERTAKAFEVGQQFLILADKVNGHGMTQREIAAECECRQVYVSERKRLVDHFGPTYVSDKIAADERVLPLTTLINRLPVAAPKPKQKKRRLTVVKDDDTDEATEIPEDEDEAVEDEDEDDPEDDRTEEERDADTLTDIERATDAQETDEAKHLRQILHKMDRAKELLQEVGIHYDALPPHRHADAAMAVQGMVPPVQNELTILSARAAMDHPKPTEQSA